MKVSTLSGFINQKTQESVSKKAKEITKNKKNVTILFWLITLCIWIITAAVGFSLALKKEPVVSKFGVNANDRFYFKYSYFPDSSSELKIAYKIFTNKENEKNLFPFNGVGFWDEVYKMKKNERKNIRITFPLGSAELAGQTVNMAIKILEIIEKNNYHDPNEVLEIGDIAVLDYEGFEGDEAFSGGKGEYYPLEIGSKSFIEGFETKMLGMKEGEKRDLNLTFPVDYRQTSLAGKDVVFKVLLRSIIKKKDL